MINGPDWWREADWTQQDAVIARKFKRTAGAVSRARVKLGLPKSPSHKQGGGRRVKGLTGPVDWAKIDFTYSDSGIAKSVGCSRQMAWLMRRKYAKQLKHVDDLR